MSVTAESASLNPAPAAVGVGPSGQVMLEGPNKPKWPENSYKGTEGCMGRDGFFGCFKDIKICLLTCCCPCLQVAVNMQRLGESGCVWGCCYSAATYAGCGFLVGLESRRRIATHLGKPVNVKDDTKDCCAVCCCPMCATMQEARILGDYTVTGEQINFLGC